MQHTLGGLIQYVGVGTKAARMPRSDAARSFAEVVAPVERLLRCLR